MRGLGDGSALFCLNMIPPIYCVGREATGLMLVIAVKDKGQALVTSLA